MRYSANFSTSSIVPCHPIFLISAVYLFSIFSIFSFEMNHHENRYATAMPLSNPDVPRNCPVCRCKAWFPRPSSSVSSIPLLLFLSTLLELVLIFSITAYECVFLIECLHRLIQVNTSSLMKTPYPSVLLSKGAHNAKGP